MVLGGEFRPALTPQVRFEIHPDLSNNPENCQSGSHVMTLLSGFLTSVTDRRPKMALVMPRCRRVVTGDLAAPPVSEGSCGPQKRGDATIQGARRLLPKTRNTNTTARLGRGPTEAPSSRYPGIESAAGRPSRGAPGTAFARPVPTSDWHPNAKPFPPVETLICRASRARYRRIAAYRACNPLLTG